MHSSVNNSNPCPHTPNMRVGFFVACTALFTTSIDTIPPSQSLSQYSINECALQPTAVEPQISLPFQQYYNIAPRKNYRELYKKITLAKWYKDAYNNASVGENLSIE